MQSHCERCVRGCVSVRASGRSWLLRTIFPQMGSRSANSEQPCAVQRDCMGLLPFFSLQRAVCWPPCVPGSEWHGCTVCAAEATAADMCRVLVAAEAGSVRKDGKTALILAAVATKRLPLSWPAHRWLYCSEGLQHRGTGQPASLRRSRRPERHRSNTYRGVSRRCCPGHDATSL